jgi:two-component system, sensor histidine kinase and response regulator
MSVSQLVSLNLTVSEESLPKLVAVYQKMADLAGAGAVWLTETDLQPLNTDNIEREWLCLLLSGNYCGLLWGKCQIGCPSLVNTIITFEPKSIKFYLSSLKTRLKHKPKLLKRLEEIDFQQLPIDGKISSTLTLELLKILSNTTAVITPKYQIEDQPVQEVLQERIEQEKILDRIEIQIDQNSDLKEIISVAIEQVLKLIQLDRLVVYQLNVAKEGKRPIDTVTYEALLEASELKEKIESILYFKDETCFSQSQQCRDKYQQGFSLAIDDVRQDSNLAPCLQELLQKVQVKAKIVTPIIVRGKLWGFLIAHQCLATRKWKSSEIDFLRQIAEYLAIAIYQAESYQQLQAQKKLLEQQVKQRARELQDALFAAQSATQLKNEFLGNMSHELRTPLTCVIGLSGTLLHWSLVQGNQTLSLEKQRQYLKTIQESGRHLLDLINDILTFSEAEAGKTLLNICELPLRNLTRTIIQDLQAEAELKQVNLELDFRLDSKIDRFFADADRLEQILYNLLYNGIKFTPAGGKVTLRIWRDHQQTVFEVEDTGIGIAQQNISLLFEKFQQLEKSRERTYGGAGLGLALTKQLIELHGGTIKVESKVGRGSIFTFYLPNEPNWKNKNPQNIQALESTSSKGKTVILIAKDEETSTLICELLTAANYQIVWLIDANVSIEQIELLKPSVLILDRDYADIPIEAIGNTLKQLNATKQIKIILLSSQLTAQNWQYFYDNGVDDYSIKPIQPTHLLNKIDVLVQGVI